MYKGDHETFPKNWFNVIATSVVGKDAYFCKQPVCKQLALGCRLSTFRAQPSFTKQQEKLQIKEKVEFPF